ncbi:MAG: hypothetical protein IJ752_03085 [Alphaproteobacteria bacterium]|nr:hypothetical protein [Alphaproteobacteria bacterium]
MFYIGQIFDTAYPLEAAEFCMESGLKIVERADGKFQIIAVQDAINTRRNDLQILLNETDWYVVRRAETGEEIPPEVLKNRALWRSELDDLK